MDRVPRQLGTTSEVRDLPRLGGGPIQAVRIMHQGDVRACSQRGTMWPAPRTVVNKKLPGIPTACSRAGWVSLLLLEMAAEAVSPPGPKGLTLL